MADENEIRAKVVVDISQVRPAMDAAASSVEAGFARMDSAASTEIARFKALSDSASNFAAKATSGGKEAASALDAVSTAAKEEQNSMSRASFEAQDYAQKIQSIAAVITELQSKGASFEEITRRLQQVGATTKEVQGALAAYNLTLERTVALSRTVASVTPRTLGAPEIRGQAAAPAPTPTTAARPKEETAEAETSSTVVPVGGSRSEIISKNNAQISSNKQVEESEQKLTNTEVTQIDRVAVAEANLNQLIQKRIADTALRAQNREQGIPQNTGVTKPVTEQQLYAAQNALDEARAEQTLSAVKTDVIAKNSALEESNQKVAISQTEVARTGTVENRAALLSEEEIQKTVEKFDQLSEAEIRSANTLTGKELNNKFNESAEKQERVLSQDSALGSPEYQEANQRASLYHDLEGRRAQQDSPVGGESVTSTNLTTAAEKNLVSENERVAASNKLTAESTTEVARAQARLDALLEKQVQDRALRTQNREAGIPQNTGVTKPVTEQQIYAAQNDVEEAKARAPKEQDTSSQTRLDETAKTATSSLTAESTALRNVSEETKNVSSSSEQMSTAQKSASSEITSAMGNEVRSIQQTSSAMTEEQQRAVNAYRERLSASQQSITTANAEASATSAISSAQKKVSSSSEETAAKVAQSNTTISSTSQEAKQSILDSATAHEQSASSIEADSASVSAYTQFISSMSEQERGAYAETIDSAQKKSSVIQASSQQEGQELQNQVAALQAYEATSGDVARNVTAEEEKKAALFGLSAAQQRKLAEQTASYGNQEVSTAARVQSATNGIASAQARAAAASARTAEQMRSDAGSVAASLSQQGLSAEEVVSALKNLGYNAEQVQIALKEVGIVAEQVGDKIVYSFLKAKAAGQLFVDILAGGGPQSMSFGLARLAATSSFLGPLLEKAFPIIGALAFIDILAQIPEYIEKIEDYLAGWNKAQKEVFSESLTETRQILEFYDKIQKQRAESAGDVASNSVTRLHLETQGLVQYQAELATTQQKEQAFLRILNEAGQTHTETITARGRGGVVEVPVQVKNIKLENEREKIKEAVDQLNEDLQRMAKESGQNIHFIAPFNLQMSDTSAEEYLKKVTEDYSKAEDDKARIQTETNLKIQKNNEEEVRAAQKNSSEMTEARINAAKTTENAELSFAEETTKRNQQIGKITTEEAESEERQQVQRKFQIEREYLEQKKALADQEADENKRRLESSDYFKAAPKPEQQGLLAAEDTSTLAKKTEIDAQIKANEENLQTSLTQLDIKGTNERYESALDKLKAQYNEEKEGSTARYTIMEQELSLARATFGEQGKEFEEVQRRMTAEVRENQAAQQKEYEKTAAAQAKILEKRTNAIIASDNDELESARKKAASELQLDEQSLERKSSGAAKGSGSQNIINQVPLLNIGAMEAGLAQQQSAQEAYYARVDSLIEENRNKEISTIQDEQNTVLRNSLVDIANEESYLKQYEALQAKKVEIAKRADKQIEDAHTQMEQQLAKEAEKEAQQEQAQAAKISNFWASEVDKMIFQSRSWHDAVQKLAEDLAKKAIEWGVKEVTQFITNQLLMRAAHKLTSVMAEQDDYVRAEQEKQLEAQVAAAKTAATVTPDTAAIAANGALANSEVGAAAATAFAAQLIASGGLDIPGALLAAGAVEAAGAPLVAQASAEKGFDVPGGNPVHTLLHPREMVLPAHIAEGVRGVTNNIKSNASSQSQSANHYYNMRFNYSPKIEGNLSPEEHGERTFKYIQGKFRRMGVKV
jgi:hypothetical protein